MRNILCAILLSIGFAGAAQAQSLNCAVKHKGLTSPMYYFAGTKTYHSDKTVDPLSVMIKEKSDPNKIELIIMDPTEDDVWDSLVATLEKSGLSGEEQARLRQLGRTRVTHAYLGLYNGILQYEHKLGADANLYEVSCSNIPAKSAWPKE